MSSIRYFLGANSAEGFYSLYDSYVNYSKGDFLWVIKGGAGCGKSSFMKMIGAAAERACLRTEYVLCSGDPESLDGVYIPALGVAYVDGTAPHVIDAQLAGADSAYLDLGRHYDTAAISEYRELLLAEKQKNALCYKKAYCLLNAAGAVRSAEAPCDISPCRKRLDGILRRELGKGREGEGHCRRRFLSAVSCKGEIFLPETCGSLCSRFYAFEGASELCGSALSYICASAIQLGYDVFLCPDTLTPQRPIAVLIPGVSIGFVSEGRLLPEGSRHRRICLEDDRGIPQDRRGERRLKKLEKQLVSEAVLSLEKAKQSHDALERIYNPHVDFDGVYEDVSRHLAILGLK